MAEVDLDRLEALARRAGRRIPLREDLRAFREIAANPEAVLALIRRVREAEADAARWHEAHPEADDPQLAEVKGWRDGH